MSKTEYRIIQPLGRGGMAEVFLAEAVGMGGFGRPVVIKKILDKFTSDEVVRHLFIEEAKLATRLLHGNIVQILDLFEIEERVHMVLEYVRGRDLLQILRQASKQKLLPLSPAVVMFIAVEILRGLDYAHDQGKVVHRDVSPPNILVSFEGQVKLSDFGIAAAFHSAGAVGLGKVGYMSPEQREGRPLDGRSDLYSLGIILYEMLAARRLFRGGKGLEEGVVPSLEAEHGVPGPLAAIVHRALEADVEARFDSALDMEEAILHGAHRMGIRPSPAPLVGLLGELYPQETALDRGPREEREGAPGTPDFVARREMELAKSLGWGEMGEGDWQGWNLESGAGLSPEEVDLDGQSWGKLLEED